MRVLFVTLPERSHLYCMTPTAWAFAAAGHEVRVASSPMAADLITTAGLTAVPVGPDHDIHGGMARNRDSQDSEFSDWNETDPTRLTWERLLLRYKVSVWHGFASYNDPMLDDLVRFAQDWRPDLVIWDPLAYAGGVAAEVVGAAHVRIMCWADVWGAMRDAFHALKEDSTEDPMAEWLTERAAPYGCEFTEAMVTGQATIDPLPVSLGVATSLRRIPTRFVPYNGPAVVADWLREPVERPRICLTLGTSNTERYGGDFVSISDILRALADLDVEVVATLLPEQIAALGEPPENVRVVRSIALHTVLPTCAAIIHHGGFGTYATALVAGVPQIVVTTRISDHVLRAEALADRGAGLYLPTADVTPEQIRAAVARTVTEPAFRENAGLLMDEALAQPAPNDVVPVLSRLT
ncbi:activator-dependent family glycosyltransferase [Actinocrispum wychmicini]|uniref:Glycosyltransferase (Activator-dependent family) n=1 Tax=Actinocrispum wychmicini TaxID=1213861 RepID=A0A4R2IIL9_9PSEU|nr:activator-dependent family glycosyltransferase [Actinocrispum wychmicini]TCO44764.1 glycosyltransferase (activator-dependent family) [Actinocrispum wychmicini]